MERLAGRVILSEGWQRWLTAFVAGVVASFVQAPFDFPAAGFVAFPLLVWLLDGAIAAPQRRGLAKVMPAAAIGWVFGFGYFVAGLWWTGAALLVEADQFAWAVPLAVAGLPALLAIFYALAAALARLLWSDDIGRIAALAAAFGLAEWLRATILSGFPWNAIGYGAMPVPLLMQSVTAVGLFGMNVAAVFVFALPALLAGSRHLRLGAILGVGLVGLHVGYGATRLSLADTRQTDTISVRLVQPSIQQRQKWDGTQRDAVFQAHLDLSTRPPVEGRDPPQTIIWPETSIPFLLTDRPDALVALGDALDEGQRLLTGLVRADTTAEPGTTRYYNSIIVIDSSGVIVDAFDKVRLVPFGEYLPFPDLFARIGLRQIVQNVGGFSAGTGRRPLQFADGIGALPFICYEIIFPQALPQDLAGSRLLVNVTNDAWFGATPGPYQHFRQAQLRAVEAGLPLVRAANNGLSAVVDPYGRVVEGLALDAVGVLDADVTLSEGRALRVPFSSFWGGMVLFFIAATVALVLNRRAAATVN